MREIILLQFHPHPREFSCALGVLYFLRRVLQRVLFFEDVVIAVQEGVERHWAFHDTRCVGVPGYTYELTFTVELGFGLSVILPPVSIRARSIDSAHT